MKYRSSGKNILGRISWPCTYFSRALHVTRHRRSFKYAGEDRSETRHAASRRLILGTMGFTPRPPFFTSDRSDICCYRPLFASGARDIVCRGPVRPSLRFGDHLAKPLNTGFGTTGHQPHFPNFRLRRDPGLSPWDVRSRLATSDPGKTVNVTRFAQGGLQGCRPLPLRSRHQFASLPSSAARPGAWMPGEREFRSFARFSRATQLCGQCSGSAPSTSPQGRGG